MAELGKHVGDIKSAI